MLKKIAKKLQLAQNTVSKGNIYESLALSHLRQQGLKQIQRNYHTRYGEIDIIAKDNDTLVFVEVRYRRNENHGTASATVHKKKQQKIIKSAQLFLQKNGLTNKMPCRFDVVGITGSIEPFKIHWIKNAFTTGSIL